MATSSSFPEPESFESLGSGSLHADCSPPAVSACFVADSAAPVFPFNGDDFSEHGFGFGRSELCPGSTSSLLSSVQIYERHVFLCYKEPRSWPPLVEAAEFDRLPRFLAAAIKARKSDMLKKTRLTICEGRDGTDSSNGDVMIFPDMVRYRGLTHFDVDAFVDEVLVHNREWLSGRPERLAGTHIFVCAHASHDARCGVSGPIVIRRFKEEISLRGGLGGHVFVRPCSHIGGHKYAGNLIIHSSNAAGEVSGLWYGYVTPDDVPILLDEHFGKGNLVDGLWRGSMDPMEAREEQAMQNSLQHCDGALPCEKNERERRQGQEQMNGHANGKVNCNHDDCQKTTEDGRKSSKRKGGKGKTNDYNRRVHFGGSGSSWWRLSSWIETWERDDTLAALAVVGAAASVAVAYHLYRNSC